jgi:hypothetical protein
VPYIPKGLTAGKPIFYVNCFAGKEKFDDETDGPPKIAMTNSICVLNICKIPHYKDIFFTL